MSWGRTDSDGLFTKVTNLAGHFADGEIPGGTMRHSTWPTSMATCFDDVCAEQNAQKHDDVAGSVMASSIVCDYGRPHPASLSSQRRRIHPGGSPGPLFAFGPYSGKILMANRRRVMVQQLTKTSSTARRCHGKTCDRWTGDVTLGGGFKFSGPRISAVLPFPLAV